MRTVAVDLNDLLGSDAPAPKIDPEAAVMRLLEWAERYTEARSGPRFGVGVFVTPSRDCPQGGAGEPFLVVETRIACDMNLQPQTCLCSRDDIRVLGINARGDVVPAWTESAQFELWIAPTSTAASGSDSTGPAPAAGETL